MLDIPSSSNDEFIDIYLRCSKYTTKKSTLSKFPNTNLSNESWRNQFKNSKNNRIEIDRKPEIFDLILFYFQSDGLLISNPNFIETIEYIDDLDFYGLPNLDFVHINSSDEETDEESYEISNNYNSHFFDLHFIKLSKKRLYRVFSVFFIILSIVLFCIETDQRIVDEEMSSTSRMTVFILDCICSVVFIMDYIKRLLKKPSKLRFIFSIMGIIDILSIIPTFIDLLYLITDSQSINQIKFIRLFRLARAFKLTRYSDGLKLLSKVMRGCLSKIQGIFGGLTILIVVFGYILYYCEGYGNPVTDFHSVPATLWCVVITLTTVGYGDMIPQTITGRIVISICTIVGVIILMAIPAPILISQFHDSYRVYKHKKQVQKLRYNKRSTISL